MMNVVQKIKVGCHRKGMGDASDFEVREACLKLLSYNPQNPECDPCWEKGSLPILLN